MMILGIQGRCWGLVWGAISVLMTACNNNEIAKAKPLAQELEETGEIDGLEPPTDEEVKAPEKPAKEVPDGKGCCGFPLKIKPLADFTTGGRNYGANRSGGSRKHAGCDLLAKVGTNVYAIDDGKIIDAAPFYLGTDAIVVLHKGGTGGPKKDYVVRYGETKANGLAAGLKVGDEVKRGQHIGYVGKLQGLSFAMVHFELFSGEEKGNLTQSGGPFRRRKDLMDPTPHIKEWIKVFDSK